MKNIILASRSADRSELLKRIDIPYKVSFSDINEEYYKQKILNPYELVKTLAREKVLSAKEKLKETETDALIIAADTIVELNGKIIGKALNKDQAFKILKQLNNQAHNLITGFAVTEIESSKLVCDYDKTVVYFSYISDKEINLYLETDEWKGRAGAYSINDKASLFIDSIEGSYSNVIGLPLNKLFRIIQKEFNLNLLEFFSFST